MLLYKSRGDKSTLHSKFSLYLFMSSINKEALLENIYDEVWEEFRIQLGLTDDQMYAKEQNGYYTFLERETYKRYEDLSN